MSRDFLKKIYFGYIFSKLSIKILNRNEAKMDFNAFFAKSGYDQASLSRKLKKTPGLVNKWVNGRGVPSYELCRELLLLGMTVEDLFGIDYGSMHAQDVQDPEPRSPEDITLEGLLKLIQRAKAQGQEPGAPQER